MRSTLLVTIAASALSLALLGSADAAWRGHEGVHRAAPGWDTGTDPAWGGSAGYGWAPRYGRAPGECVTDEGGGRLAPCDYGR
jgi:hypothetical protein